MAQKAGPTLRVWLCLLIPLAAFFGASYVYNGAAAFSQRHFWEHHQAAYGRGGVAGSVEVTLRREVERPGGRTPITVVTCRGTFRPDDGGPEVRRVLLRLPDDCREGAEYPDARLVPATESRWDPTDENEAHVRGGGGWGGRLMMALVATGGQFLVSLVLALLVWDPIDRAFDRNRPPGRGRRR